MFSLKVKINIAAGKTIKKKNQNITQFRKIH